MDIWNRLQIFLLFFKLQKQIFNPIDSKGRTFIAVKNLLLGLIKNQQLKQIAANIYL